ncbi:ribonuclease H-like protein [Apiospora marii]|uniref:Ribonuclease H-like protein n=1 Tax=Apiospora marii TaxID=335849 RepID=A0ABR1RJY8_9PEZI
MATTAIITTTGVSSENNVEAITEVLAKTELGDVPLTGLINTPAAIAALVDNLYDQPTTSPSLFLDLEGVNLSRQDPSLSFRSSSSLKAALTSSTAFSTPGKACKITLKDLLESDTIPKVFFDVRNDSDALFGNFNVDLAGIQDLQLMELATRAFNRRHINGLSRCIERDCPMTSGERYAWKHIKEQGVKLFAPEKGGSYEVFNERPLPEKVRLYCVQDVQFLPRLWSYYDAKMSEKWKARVLAASKDRVILSQTPDFNGKGQHMALAPKDWSRY